CWSRPTVWTRGTDGVAVDRECPWDPQRRPPRGCLEIDVFLQGGMTVWSVGVLLMSGKLTPCIASRWYRYPQNSWNPCAVGSASVWSPRRFFPNSPVV